MKNWGFKIACYSVGREVLYNILGIPMELVGLTRLFLNKTCSEVGFGKRLSKSVVCWLGFPQRRPGFKPGSGHVGFCVGQKWCWGRFSLWTSVSPANLHSICFCIIIFTITRCWHSRPGVAAVPIASQTRIKKKKIKSVVFKVWSVDT
jgi:hypothetical protein